MIHMKIGTAMCRPDFLYICTLHQLFRNYEKSIITCSRFDLCRPCICGQRDVAPFRDCKKNWRYAGQGSQTYC